MKLILLMAALAVSGVAEGQIVVSCVNKTTLVPRIVAAASACNTKTETLKTWSQTGPVGPAGAKGGTGATGLTGAVGAKGATGVQGAPGVTGANGATGAQGIPGVAGPTGPQGPQGPAGPSGSGGNTSPTVFTASIQLPTNNATTVTATSFSVPASGTWDARNGSSTLMAQLGNCSGNNFSVTAAYLNQGVSRTGTLTAELMYQGARDESQNPSRWAGSHLATSCSVTTSSDTGQSGGAGCSVPVANGPPVSVDDPSYGYNGPFQFINLSVSDAALFSGASVYVSYTCG